MSNINENKIPHSSNLEQTSPKFSVTGMVHTFCRTKHYSYKTEKSYLGWIKRFSLFHKGKPLSKMGTQEVKEFISYLAVNQNVAASTQNQAFNALIFFYKNIAKIDLGEINAIRAKKSKILPEVFTKEEVKAILNNLQGTEQLMVSLLYGCGLRLNECLALRIKDLDFVKRKLTVHNGKGGKDRVVPLPVHLIDSLQVQINKVREVYLEDHKNKIGVSLPNSLEKKYPNAPYQFNWYFLFPARKVCVNPKWVGTEPKRHSIHETVLQKAVKLAMRNAGITKHGGCHTFRHSFCTHLLENGYNVRQVQELAGHSSLETTMGYLHVLNLVETVKSPFDSL